MLLHTVVRNELNGRQRGQKKSGKKKKEEKIMKEEKGR